MVIANRIEVKKKCKILLDFLLKLLMLFKKRKRFSCVSY